MIFTGEPPASSVTLLGTNVRYLRLGNGPPLVLIHGLGAASFVWRYNIEFLAGKFTVYALDMPGHGGSGGSTVGYNLASAVSHLDSFFDHLSLRTASVVGSSAGGLAALRYTLDHPARVHKLVLVDSAGLGKELALFLRLMSLPLLGEFAARPSLRNINALLRQLFYNQDRIPKGLAQHMLTIRRLPGRKAALLQLLRSGAWVGGQKDSIIQTVDLPLVKAKTFILWGRDYKLIPVKHGLMAAQAIPGATINIFDQCGHWPQMEKPEEFNQVLSEFLLDPS